METSEFLPKDDQDVQLGLRMNEANEAMLGFDGIEDPLIQSLLNFKKKNHEKIESLSDIKRESWNEIELQTKPRSANIIPIRSTFRYSAVAATILIAAFVGIFWFNNVQQQPKLIAESGNSIELVTLADGSKISLRPHSLLYEVEVSEQKRAYKISGEGFFSVAKDTQRPFSVDGGTGTITVLGTRFNVSTWGNETSVYLEEGSIRLDDMNQNNLILVPGQKATADKNGISTPVQTNGNEFKDWLDNTLILNSTPVSEVAKELEHHFKINLDISEFENSTEPISGSIALENAEQTLNDLGIILGGTFRKVNGDTFAFIPLN